MSDLYRKVRDAEVESYPTGRKSWVPIYERVETVGTLTVDKRQWVEVHGALVTPAIATELLTDLPPGVYDIVPNEDRDPDWERDHGT